MKNERSAADGQIEARIDFVFDLHLLIEAMIDRSGLTRAELASRLGISRARLSQIMRPEANPTAYTISDLFHALGEEAYVDIKSKRGIRPEYVLENENDRILHALFSRPSAQEVKFAMNENFEDGAYAEAA